LRAIARCSGRSSGGGGADAAGVARPCSIGRAGGRGEWHEGRTPVWAAGALDTWTARVRSTSRSVPRLRGARAAVVRRDRAACRLAAAGTCGPRSAWRRDLGVIRPRCASGKRVGGCRWRSSSGTRAGAPASTVCRFKAKPGGDTPGPVRSTRGFRYPDTPRPGPGTDGGRRRTQPLVVRHTLVDARVDARVHPGRSTVWARAAPFARAISNQGFPPLLALSCADNRICGVPACRVPRMFKAASEQPALATAACAQMCTAQLQ
jgi:hypothetical protein